MDYRTLMSAAVLVSGCGTGEVLEPTPKLVFQEEPRCLSCDVPAAPEQESIEAAPDVRASPKELLFYPMHGAADEHEPSSVTVTNNYDFIVMVTRAEIVDDTSPGVQANGAHYFVIDTLEGWIELSPKDAVVLPVWFVGSAKQQSALLTIFTTAYEHRRLEVALTGKTLLE